MSLVEYVPPEWAAWSVGAGRCPYCEGLPVEDHRAICDCWQYEREQAALAAVRQEGT
jgi:hypothetical protein